MAQAARAESRLPPQEAPQTARSAEGAWAARPADSAGSERASTSGASESQAGGGRRATDTGIQLAKAATADKPVETTEEAEFRANERKNRELRDEMRRGARQAGASPATMRKLADPKKGKKVDPTKMLVADPSEIPEVGSAELSEVGTAWRPDKLKEMTYTQFWRLIQQRQIDRVNYTADCRSVWVTTKASAPGGARTEKVGLPWDPELYDHMLTHGVFIDAVQPTPLEPIIAALVRFAAPLVFAYYLIQISFRLGIKRKTDKLFGTARMEMVKNSGTTFADVAGVDQVKAEITEIVTFLRNPRKFLAMGARSPAGILLVGPPGTGKTLLAKAIAGESGVPFFSASGAEFMEIFVGVGAARVRDTFRKARKAAPCILFIDEFDGLGKQRSISSGGDDESVHTINQLLTEMDGFEDNTGVVVMAATNRPAALDNALTRPGRFDRIISMPLPNLEGRKEIYAVHARDKQMAPRVTFERVARATAGYTGADIMNLMNQAAILTVRAGREEIGEDDLFTALEKIQAERLGGAVDSSQSDEAQAPPQLRRNIAVYEAARALLGYITPDFDEISKVVACPNGLAVGHTYFIPSEEHLESGVTTRGFMEAKLVVSLAGRVSERLVLGDANVSTTGGSDLDAANRLAREMVYRCGFSSKLGPVSLMDQEEVYLNRSRSRAVANISTDLARVAQSEIEQLLDAAEAKAYYGLAKNYAALEALTHALIERETLSGPELRDVLAPTVVEPFESPYLEGFGWSEASGELVFPGSPAADEATDADAPSANGNGSAAAAEGNGASPADFDEFEDAGTQPLWKGWHPKNPYQVRFDMPELLSPELQ